MAPYLGEVLKENVKSTYALTLVKARESQIVCRDRVNRPVILWTSVGKGGIFWVLAEMSGSNFLPPEIDLLQRIAEHALPFTVRGDIQHLVNRTKDGWIVGLFNNHGVYKTDPYQEAEVNSGEASPVEVVFAGKKVGRVSEWLTSAEIRPARANNQFKISVSVPAGEVRILQLTGAR